METLTPVKHKEDVKQPPQYAIILHMSPSIADLLIAGTCVVHVLADHLNIGRDEGIKIMSRAMSQRRAVVKTVSKDVGETLMAEVNQCPVAQTTPNFKFVLEPL